MARRASRVDGNQTAIVQRFRECGASVLHLHMVGDDCPDLLIGTKGVNVLVELKTDTGTLSLGQREFIKGWRGADVWVIRSPDEAQMLVNEVGV